MRVLLVGSADSIWLKKYIDNIGDDPRIDFSVLSPENHMFSEFYREKNVCIYTAPFSQRSVPEEIGGGGLKGGGQKSVREMVKSILPDFLSKRIYYYLASRRVKKFLISQERFDVVHFHYVSEDTDLIYYKSVRRYDARVILTYWGSDLLRNDRPRSNKRIRKRADSIVCLSEKLAARYLSLYGKGDKNKLKTIGFGISGYDYIDRIYSENRGLDAKGLLSLPESKLHVAVGYNASEAQQHVGVIRAIARLPKEYKEELHLILQLSYGKSEDCSYYDLINRELEASGCSWTIINEFLDDYNSALLRCDIDIFVHAQVTDSLSASMLEYLYAGAVVINGSWLDYPMLSALENKCLSFDDFDGLTGLLESVMKGSHGREKMSASDKETLRAINSWQSVRSTWLGLYAP
ncbi:glycosyltransferase [Castellaniella denitrificans]|uniref:glycosyltransferase n=1 Tax=Castellaniella denitrificans TaxID=56119 RepID=UPI00360CDE01